ncbi:MAG: hypothetical protein Q9161_004175 [Pseudevernia consocians]
MAASIGPQDVVSMTKTTPTASHSGWATKQDWTSHQALIGELYRTKTLAEVMDHMARQHGFRATEKMYKTRIKQWGLDKKNKANEMRAIVRKKKQLGDQGMSTAFRVRGQLVDYVDVVRYWERKGVRIDDVIAQRSNSKTPEAVDFFVSLPSPTRTPESMTVPERILVSIRDYCKGSFETGTWVVTNPRKNCETTKVQEDPLAHLSALHTQSSLACKLFAGNQFEEAGQTLVSATSEIERILLAEHPDTLQCLFTTLASIFRQRRYEIALAILRQFSALAEILVGEGHPLRCICGSLASIHPSQFEDIIARCNRSASDQFENFLGPMNWSTLLSRIFLIKGVDLYSDMSYKASQLQGLLRKCEATLGFRDPRTFEIRISLVWYYYRKSDHVEAIRLGWDIVAYARHVHSSLYSTNLLTGGLWLVAASQYALGETDSAEAYLREAIDIRLSEIGPYDDFAVHCLVILEEWLVEKGQLNSAAEVRKRWKDTIPECTMTAERIRSALGVL